MNLDELFFRELKETINTRRAQAGGSKRFSIRNLPVPKSMEINRIPKTPMVYIKGIHNAGCFEKLNNTEGQLLKSSSVKKRVVNSDSTFRKNSDGKFIQKDVSIKSGFVAVVSDINIAFRRYEVINGVKKRIKYPEGYDYVDYIDTPMGRKFIYLIPKENVYKVNMCALIITNNAHRVFYRGCKLVLQNGNSVYVYVTPFRRYSELSEHRVLGVKSTPNFDSEIKEMLMMWIKLGVIFDFRSTWAEEDVKGVRNPTYFNLNSPLAIDEFVKYSKSMAIDNDEELVEY